MQVRLNLFALGTSIRRTTDESNSGLSPKWLQRHALCFEVLSEHRRIMDTLRSRANLLSADEEVIAIG